MENGDHVMMILRPDSTCLKSVRPTPTPPPRKTKRSSFEARTTTPDEMEKFLKMDSIQDFDTIKESIRDKLKEFGSHLFVLNLENQIIVLV